MMTPSIRHKAIRAALTATGLAAATSVQATVIDMTRVDHYDTTATYSSTQPAAGTLDTVAATGTLTGTFLFDPFTATVVRSFTATGSHTWSDADDPSAQGSYSYSFDVGANQVGVALFFDWSTSEDIPILQVFDCSGGTPDPTPHGGSAASCTAVDSDNDGAPGHTMATLPFDNTTLAFYGNVVPIPAAVWLFGSGLIGLVGVTRRRKSA